MPDKMKPAGYYTMAELKGQKAGKQNSSPKKESLGPFSAPSISKAPIGPSKPKPISVEETYFSTAKANKPAAKPAAEPNTSYKQSLGSKQKNTPTNFRSEQAENLNKMLSNYSAINESAAASFRQNRLTKKAAESSTSSTMPKTDVSARAAKTRSKGEAALKSGNIEKSRRMAKRYDRQTTRLKKS